jgi:membrane protein implicated in regulation of membrane protease activity
MDAIKEFLKPEIIWILIGLVLLIMEFMLPGLIIAFFGVGAIVVAIVCLITDISVEAQLIIFIVSSVLSLLCLRSWLKGIFIGHVKGRQDITEDIEEFVGERAVVVEKITPKARGKVELHGTNWTAEADVEIAEGAAVEVIAKNSLTLRVKTL